MANLYDIEKNIYDLIEKTETMFFDTESKKFVDPETGEVIDLWEEIEKADGDRKQKLANTVRVILQLENDSQKLEERANAILARSKAKAKAAKDYRMRVADSMKRFEDKRIETDDFIVTTRTSKSVEILNADEIPPEFMKTTTVVEPMKKLIADELKKGNEVSGATLKENTSLQIR